MFRYADVTLNPKEVILAKISLAALDYSRQGEEGGGLRGALRWQPLLMGDSRDLLFV